MTQSEFWTKLKRKLKDVSLAAADFTEEQAIIGKLKFDIINLKRKIENNHREIGALVTNLSRLSTPPNPLADPEIKKLLKDIQSLEKLIEENRKAISQVSDEFRARGAARAKENEEEEGRFYHQPAEEKPYPENIYEMQANIKQAQEQRDDVKPAPKKRPTRKPAARKTTTVKKETKSSAKE